MYNRITLSYSILIWRSAYEFYIFFWLSDSKSDPVEFFECYLEIESF